MLAIRMQRTGRKGYASFRVIVQDSRFAPTSGRVVAKLGHHNPHTKETVINKEKAEKYLANGAQPSPRVVRLFELEKVKMPEWVEKTATDKKRSIKNPEKLRKNQPEEPAAEAKEKPAEDAPAPEAEEAKADAAPAEESTSDEKQEEPAEAEEKPEASKEDDSKSDETEKKDDTSGAEQK